MSGIFAFIFLVGHVWESTGRVPTPGVYGFIAVCIAMDVWLWLRKRQ